MSNMVDDFPVSCTRFSVGLSWDSCPCDCDLQAVAFTSAGQIKDAVYYNNMKAFKNAITHSGDERTGDKTGLDEFVWVTFPRLPGDVKVIVFVVACYTGGTLKDVVNGKLHLHEETHEREVMQSRLEESAKEVDLIGCLYRNDHGQWMYRHIEVPAAPGQHFIDILEPTIGNCVRSIVPEAPKRIKACFAMEKGSVVDFAKSSEIRNVKIGLGWDCEDQGVDLDVSAVMLSSPNTEHCTVFFGNLEAPGVKHSGDNLTGEGSGDDETITIDLLNVEPCVQQVFFVINIYSRGKTFAQVKNPYSRVITDGGDELARYTLRDAGGEAGLLVSRLLRAPDGMRWSFQAIGQPCHGRTYKDSLGLIMEAAGLRPQAYQLRQLSSGSLDEVRPAAQQAPPAARSAPPPAAVAAPAPAAKSGACSVM